MSGCHSKIEVPAMSGFEDDGKTRKQFCLLCHEVIPDKCKCVWAAVRELQAANLMKSEMIGAVDSAYDEVCRELEKRINDFEKRFIEVESWANADRSDYVDMRTKQAKNEIEKASKFMECLASLELKLQDQIRGAIKTSVKADCKLENAIDQVKDELSNEIAHLQARLNDTHECYLALAHKELEEKFNILMLDQHNLKSLLESLSKEQKIPYKCPVCDGESFRLETNVLAERVCLGCKGEGIVWG